MKKGHGFKVQEQVESVIINVLQVGGLVERTLCYTQNHVHNTLLTKWGTGLSGLFSPFADKLKTNVWTPILHTVNGVIMIMFWIDVGAGFVRQLMKLLAEKNVLCFILLNLSADKTDNEMLGPFVSLFLIILLYKEQIWYLLAYPFENISGFGSKSS